MLLRLITLAGVQHPEGVASAGSRGKIMVVRVP
jgi:hypothetical protein